MDAAGRDRSLPAAVVLAEPLWLTTTTGRWPGRPRPSCRPGPVVAPLVATMWALRDRPSVGFVGGWFFLILAPTSSVLPLIEEFTAERRSTCRWRQ